MALRHEIRHSENWLHGRNATSGFDEAATHLFTKLDRAGVDDLRARTGLPASTAADTMYADQIEVLRGLLERAGIDQTNTASYLGSMHSADLPRDIAARIFARADRDPDLVLPASRVIDFPSLGGPPPEWLSTFDSLVRNSPPAHRPD